MARAGGSKATASRSKVPEDSGRAQRATKTSSTARGAAAGPDRRAAAAAAASGKRQRAGRSEGGEADGEAGDEAPPPSALEEEQEVVRGALRRQKRSRVSEETLAATEQAEADEARWMQSQAMQLRVRAAARLRVELAREKRGGPVEYADYWPQTRLAFDGKKSGGSKGGSSKKGDIISYLSGTCFVLYRLALATFRQPFYGFCMYFTFVVRNAHVRTMAPSFVGALSGALPCPCLRPGVL